MIGTRLMLSLIVTLLITGITTAGTIFGHKPKTEAQVKRLIETLRNDSDEKKRRSSVAELREADPRTHVDVVPALVSALQRDPSANVRAEAAEAIGQFKMVFGIAGLSLESASESDPSRMVRDSARQALWEYHLVGYRSARGADGISGQSPEPPLAKPGSPRRIIEIAPVVAITPVVKEIAPAPSPKHSTAVSTSIRPVITSYSPQPIDQSAPLPEPDLLTSSSSIRMLLTVTPPEEINFTSEPSIAAPPRFAVAPLPVPLGEPHGRQELSPVSIDNPSELEDLPPISLPPSFSFSEMPLRPTLSKGNPFGPRVADQVITGIRRFKHSE